MALLITLNILVYRFIIRKPSIITTPLMQTFNTCSLSLIFLVFVVVKCQDIGQTPLEDEPVQIMKTDKQSADRRWILFKKTFNKVYPNFDEEKIRFIFVSFKSIVLIGLLNFHLKRRENFEDNVKIINSHNEKYNRVLACGRNPTKICLVSIISSYKSCD